ncbi:DNA repair and recombination protein RadA [Candidatus Woesearchaeota archaeon]|nr:DNA repair and recombination protein RadA [Candidatus Woesearchaeota archaeon]
MTEETKKEKILDDITKLPGVGKATSEKLVSSGFDNLMSLAVASPGELIEASEITENTAKKIIYAAREKLNMGFESGIDLLKKAEKVERITTGSKEVDRLLGGGLETGTLTEFHGSYASGKSQLGYQLAINVQLPKEKGGLNSGVIFLDTESTFRPSRIKQLAEAQGLDPEEVLKNIKIARCFNSDHQTLLAEKIGDIIKEGFNAKLVIIDSLMALFRSDYTGRGTLADRQQKLNKHLHILQKLADMYNVAVYITNQVMSKPDVFFGDPTEAVGGNIVGHGINIRCYVRKGKKGTRVAKLVDSSYLPESEAIFKITPEGIQDA